MLSIRVPNLAALFFIIVMTGCATVPTASVEEDSLRKSFGPPSPGMSAIYVFRVSTFGSALKKTVMIDGVPLGQSAPKTYFYKEVSPGDHTLATESEFGENTLVINTEAGKLYFVEQYIKLGVMVGGANLKLVDEAKGRENVLKCSLAANPYN